MFRCNMEPEIWTKKITDNRHHRFECIAIYVDDLPIASKTPETIVSMLQDKHKFK